MKKILFPVLIAAGVLYFIFQFFGSQLAAAGLQQVLGVKVNVQRIHLKLYPTELGIYGLKIHNPEGFKESVLASVPEVFVRVEVKDLFQHRAHVQRIVLNIDQVTLERAGGKVNLIEFLNKGKKKEAERKEKQQPPTAPQQKQPKEEPVKTQIDEAIISLGTITIRESSSTGVPVTKNINLELKDFTLNHVDGTLSLVEKIVFEVLRKAGLSTLGSQFNIVASNVSEQAGELAAKAQESLSNLFKK